MFRETSILKCSRADVLQISCNSPHLYFLFDLSSVWYLVIAWLKHLLKPVLLDKIEIKNKAFFQDPLALCSNNAILQPGWFPGIAGNTRNHGNDGKFHKSQQILNQTRTYINILCLGKISRYKTVRINFPWIPGFRISPMIKYENTETLEINTKLSKSKSTHC